MGENIMTHKEIGKELQKIYKERKSWPKINRTLRYKISKHEIQRREAIFSLQQILYKIEDAKKERNKGKEYFNLALYYLTKTAEIDMK